jgi:uncharacterized protein (DUF488 family)
MKSGLTVYTIGHSTRSVEEFMSLLSENHIALLADVRRFPSSAKYPWFNKEALENSLQKISVRYIHFESLGGRRKPVQDSPNIIWKNNAFRGYADYMDTAEFKTAVKILEEFASKNITCYMCSESVWWRCHRSLISDYLKNKGWKVMHIMAAGKLQEHPYTAPAKSRQQNISFPDQK